MSTLVVSLVRGTVRTAYGAARHPIATASQAVGLATDAVRLGVGVVHGRIPGSPPEQRPSTVPGPGPGTAHDPARAAESRPTTAREAAPAAQAAPAAPSASSAPTGAPLEPVTDAPGEPEGSGPTRIPTPDEIAVRAAGPMPGAPGEAFSTEPKVASREVEHGGSATGDREAVDGFLEDMAAGEPESPVDAIGSTTGTPEPGAEASVLSEAETLQRGAERNPGE
ncbi:hypothetical protein [Nocardioides aurantiacus]|uniref:Uncharacterized protein n=1 Tax=Nocardioides aurantiacus TaxID=86796 RepID=A0A3N2CRD4_9ACTN|nr:hypothetical protein [Nocardioides aurantiacus]ROR90095.1 hypothetical protein EDD33_0930 [Nocardioides aurantiacus]